MATIKNPFFSLSASGTAAGINVQPINAGHIARRPAAPPSFPPSSGQLAQRERVKNAASTWRTLAEIDKARWRALYLACHTPSSFKQIAPFYHGYAHFLREYMAQNIKPPAIPLVPIL